MALWKSDAVIELSLLTAEDGGRSGPTPTSWFGCPMAIDGRYFDARIDLTNVGSISPGDTVEVPIRFLEAGVALPLLTVGKVFSLWEGRIIGHAKVLSIAQRT